MSADGGESAGLQRLLAQVAGRVSNRKLDLFNNWCCRTLRPYLSDRRSIAAARYAECHIDEGWPDTEERAEVLAAARQAVEELREWLKAAPTALEHRRRRVYAYAALVASQTVGNDLPNRGVLSNSMYTAYAFSSANDNNRVRFGDELSVRDKLREEHLLLQEAILLDLVGDPLQPVAFDPRWRTSDTVGVASGIYEERAFARLPILADALMDAGCEDERIIAHCRGAGPHIRGCWVVDMILGKE